MTTITLPGTPYEGLSDHGRRTAPQMIALAREYAASELASAQAALAASDEEFRVVTHRGIHRKTARDVIQEGREPARTPRTTWPVGTVLRGTEHYPDGGSSTATILITYVSDQIILARNVDTGRESSWDLSLRDWQEVAR
ncbi:hypothetical protein [Cellulosimicrobium sp. Marseille-Q4280]|uniref:DUF7241 domain-containing protein n=1 Tax=Cellulosimicrobium sp. Marseille-Q4280 TaxID=2937992 RepID=UPI002041EA5E|nr:hypothetical protein [Cellulosimicrobium sp. Marseille-Q4280]